MAIITVSRKLASLGDETSAQLANLLGYRFVERKELEQHLLDKGLSSEKLKKYDEKRPGFLASLSRDRDEYFDLLREVVYEIANQGNCIFIGRGGFAILRDIPSVYAIRLISNDDVRRRRIMDEFNYSERQATNLMKESDANREGFHKCFFNVEQKEASFYNMVLNTSCIKAEEAALIIKAAFEITMKKENEEKGASRISELLQAQTIVNHISFKLKLPIYFLDAEVNGDNITLHGISESPYVVEEALNVAKSIFPDKKMSSSIKMINEYNNKHY